MNKLLLTFGLVLLCIVTLDAQQLPQFSQFHRNQSLFNPGATGAYDFVDITVGTRYQWLGMRNDDQGNVAPRTLYFNGTTTLGKNKEFYNPALRVSSGPIKNPKVGTGRLKHALGGQVLADEYGAFRQLSIAGTYAVHVPMSQEINLSLGIRGGIRNHSFLREKAQVLSSLVGGPADITYDNFIANGFNRTFIDIGSGLFLYSQRFFVGFSGYQLTQDFVSFGSGITNFNPVRHFDVSGGVILSLNDDFTLMPAISLKLMSPSVAIGQLNIQTEYKEWLWFGLGYRHTESFSIMAGGNINQRFKLGYSFDYVTSRINHFAAGGHELVLGFMLR